MTGLIANFGIFGVFVLMVPESACIPVPSELTLLFAGAAVAAGWMSLPLAVIAATAGNLVGSVAAYALGASHLLERIPAARAIVERWGALLDRHGDRAVLIARLLPLARTFVSLPAGARHVHLARFVVLTTVGCAIWALGWVVVGDLAAGAWRSVDSVLGRVLLGAGLLIVTASLVRRHP